MNNKIKHFTNNNYSSSDLNIFVKLLKLEISSQILLYITSNLKRVLHLILNMNNKLFSLK